MTYQSASAFNAPDQRTLNLGADYTFPTGSGLYVLGEYFVLEDSTARLGPSADASLAAFSARYPISLLDSLSAIVYLDTRRHEAYRFVNWQRTYDHWQFYVMGFWNPRERALYQGELTRTGRSPLTGRGLQLMAVFNH